MAASEIESAYQTVKTHFTLWWGTGSANENNREIRCLRNWAEEDGSLLSSFSGVPSLPLSTPWLQDHTVLLISSREFSNILSFDTHCIPLVCFFQWMDGKEQTWAQSSDLLGAPYRALGRLKSRSFASRPCNMKIGTKPTKVAKEF